MHEFCVVAHAKDPATGNTMAEVWGDASINLLGLSELNRLVFLACCSMHAPEPALGVTDQGVVACFNTMHEAGTHRLAVGVPWFRVVQAVPIHL